MLAVAKSRKPEPEVKTDRSGRNTAPVQVEKDLARMAAVVASHDGITQAALVSPILRPFLLAQYARVQEAIRREIASQDKTGT
jgi:hypothetical protein